MAENFEVYYAPFFKSNMVEDEVSRNGMSIIPWFDKHGHLNYDKIVIQ